MTKLSVNLNKVALLRNSRALGIPSVVRAAETVVAAGAHGITVHPRPDERHIRVQDVHDLAQLLSRHPGIEFNIEGNPFENLIDLALQVKPHQCTLVPDDPGAFTSDHGWDLPRDAARLKPVIAQLKAAGIRVSLFMDAAPDAIVRVVDIGADRVELYTEPYASAFGHGTEKLELQRFAKAAEAARRAGLGVNAGHDLNRQNLPRFLSTVKNVLEVSIGHALIADALDSGLAQTVRDYLGAMRVADTGCAA
jgi:pyridoxine 5-phosphate synthase